MSEKWINNFGTINQSKAGKLYIKFNEDADIKKDDVVFMQKKTDEIDDKVSRGVITEEEGENQKEKFHFIKYVLTKPPREG
jgi:hypothetical protein